MVDDKVPPPSPANFPVSPPRAPFLSPYGMFPDVDAARDALAAEAAGGRGGGGGEPPTIDPLAVPFDPTKPTIDQTRSNAIDSIRNNFAALNVASAIDPTLYLKKTGDVATDLSIGHPTSTSGLNLNPIAGQVGAIYWKQAAVTKYAAWAYLDSQTWYLTAYPDAGGQFNVFSARRSDGALVIGGNVAISGGFSRTTQSAPIHLEIYKSTPVVLMQHADGSTFRVLVNSAGAYIDSWLASTGADVAPAVGARSLFLRTQDASGAVQNRLTLDPGGGILAGVGAFVGNYAWLGGPATFALDFHTCQTAGIQAGSTVMSITMMAGQIARIFVNGSGAITLPAAVHVPVGGATWGTVATIVSLLALDASGNNIFATFVPF